MSSIVDIISGEDRVQVKFTDFYNLVKGCTERDVLMNGIKNKIPHAHIQCMIEGSVDEESEN